MGSGGADDAGGVTEGVPSVRLAFYANEHDVEPEIVEWAWADVVTLLTGHEITQCQPCKGKNCPSKMGLAFSPAPPTLPCRCADCRRADGPRFHRLDKNVEFIHMLVFDVDHVTWAELDSVCARFDGFESLLYSTHNHLRGGPEDCCVRIVFPLHRPLTPAEFYIVHSEVRRRYQLQWWRPGAVKISGVDPVVKDVSRLFFMPTAPEGTTPFAGYAPGGFLDIETLLREAPGSAKNSASPPSQASVPRPVSAEGPVDMEALRQALRDYKPRNMGRDDGRISRKELVRRVLAQEPLVKYEETGLRNDAVHRLGSILGHVLPATAPEEAVVEIARQSLNTLPVYPDDGEEDTLDKRYEVFRNALKRGVESAEVKRVAFEEKRQADRDLHKKLKQRFRLKGSDAKSKASSDEEDDGSVGTEEEELSLEDLEALFVKTKNGDAMSVGANVELVLGVHPEWNGKLSYNEFTKSPEFAPDAPIYVADSEEAITAIQHWFQTEYKINLQRSDIMNVVRHCAKKRSFNPIKDYLNDLVWDGTARINDWLRRYCGARVEEGSDNASLVERMGRRWLMSAVARALDPGCKADTVLILEGEQGLKKSMVFEVLAGQQWFTDSPVNIGHKDSMQIVGMKWIIELAELSAFHGSETEQQKGFFSSRVDTFRPPFGLTPQSFPRQSVCGATTNKTNYMNDETGNRRYWAVWCTKILIGDLKRDRDQLWAEAVHYYKQSFECAECKVLMSSNGEERCHDHRWWFEASENVELDVANTERLRNDFADGIIDYLLKMKPDERPTWLTMHDICRQLSISPDRIATQSSAVSRALKTLEFRPDRVRQDGMRMRVFFTPDTILDAPQRQKVRGLPRIRLVEPALETH